MGCGDVRLLNERGTLGLEGENALSPLIGRHPRSALVVFVVSWYWLAGCAPSPPSGTSARDGDALVANVSGRVPPSGAEREARGTSLQGLPPFVTVLPGSHAEQARDVTVDAGGNIIIVGGTHSTDFLVDHDLRETAGDTAYGSAGPMSVFVVKLDPAGVVIWSTLLGGPNYDRAYAVEVDETGDIYVAGRAGPGFPTTPGVVQAGFAGDTSADSAYGQQDGFICKLSADGSQLVWSTYLGDGDLSFIRDLDLDPTGNIYVALHSRGPFPHVTAGADQAAPGGGYDVVVARLDRTATRVTWATHLGGAGDEQVPTIRVDREGRVFVVTATTSDGLATAAAYQPERRGASDMLVARYTPAGLRDATTYYGGSADEQVETHHLALDPDDRPVIGAFTMSADLPIRSNVGPFRPRYGGDGDGFVAILSPGLTELAAATYVGGSGGEHVEGMAVDSTGHVHVGGETRSYNLPSTGPTRFQGVSDAWVATLSPGLDDVLALDYLGGGNRDAQRSLWIDHEGNVISTGWTNFAGFFDGSGDVYVARIVTR